MLNQLLSCLALAMLVTASAGAQQATGRPPNSFPARESGNTVFCRCNAGFEKREGACRPVPTMRQGPVAPPPSMRAMTRPECVRFAGEALRQDVARCRRFGRSFVNCLKQEGISEFEVECALSSLVAALAVVYDPTKVTVKLAIAGVAASCGPSVGKTAEKCAPRWGTCEEEPLVKHKAAIAACPAS